MLRAHPLWPKASCRSRDVCAEGDRAVRDSRMVPSTRQLCAAPADGVLSQLLSQLWCSGGKTASLVTICEKPSMSHHHSYWSWCLEMDLQG